MCLGGFPHSEGVALYLERFFFEITIKFGIGLNTVSVGVTLLVSMCVYIYMCVDGFCNLSWRCYISTKGFLENTTFQIEGVTIHLNVVCVRVPLWRRTPCIGVIENSEIDLEISADRRHNVNIQTTTARNQNPQPARSDTLSGLRQGLRSRWLQEIAALRI